MKIERLKALMTNPTYTRKKIRLNDGRLLSYSECGSIKSGMPVLFCFGLMTSSVAVMMLHDHAIQCHLRIIAVDYPGIGESTYQEDRTLGGWADDMHQFLDQMVGQNSKVRLMGHSMGGLHVLALLSNKPFKARVVRTVLLSPWFHMDGDEYNCMWMNMAHRMPDFVQSSIIPAMLTNMSSGSMQLLGWSNPQHTLIKAASMVTSYSMLQGQAGNAQMIRLALSKQELFLPQDVENSIVIYHGGNDKLVLEKCVKKLVRLLRERNCRPRLVQISDADHNTVFSDMDNLPKVMKSLLGDPDDRNIGWTPAHLIKFGSGDKTSAMSSSSSSSSDGAKPPTISKGIENNISHRRNQNQNPPPKVRSMPMDPPAKKQTSKTGRERRRKSHSTPSEVFSGYDYL